MVQEIEEKLMGRMNGSNNEENDGSWEVLIRDTV